MRLSPLEDTDSDVDTWSTSPGDVTPWIMVSLLLCELVTYSMVERSFLKCQLLNKTLLSTESADTLFQEVPVLMIILFHLFSVIHQLLRRVTHDSSPVYKRGELWCFWTESAVTVRRLARKSTHSSGSLGCFKDTRCTTLKIPKPSGLTTRPTPDPQPELDPWAPAPNRIRAGSSNCIYIRTRTTMEFDHYKKQEPTVH